LLNEGAATLEIPHHVSERDLVALFPGRDGDLRLHAIIRARPR
jgi:hypothetical protein